MIDVFHKLHSFFVSVNQGQAVVLWIHCQQLEGRKGREEMSFTKMALMSFLGRNKPTRFKS